MDPTDIAMLFGTDDEASDSAALANALRGQEQAGLLGLLTGDKVLGGVGTQLLSGAKTRKEGALRKALAVADAKRQAMAAASKRGQDLEDQKAKQAEWDRQNGITSGQLMARAKVMAQAQGGKDAAAATERVHSRAEELRKELASNPITKQFQEVETSYGKIRGAAAKPSAAGDMALVFSFMKMMDPGSSVREGEYANAKNAGGVPDRLRNAWNNLRDGQLLNPAQRADFLRQARGFRNTHAAQYRGLTKKYGEYAPRVGVDPGDVLFGLEAPPDEEDAPTPGAPAGGSLSLDDWSEEDEKRLQELEAAAKQRGAQR